MGREAFVQPNIIRCDLPGGGWVELKEKLSNGESKALNARAFSVAMDPNSPQGFTPIIDFGLFTIAKLASWIVDWDMTENGKVKPVTLESIRALDPDIAVEIEAVIDAHVEALGQQKNALDLAPNVAVLSP